MSQERPTYSKGLEGVIADESSICLVRGGEGQLFYRGHAIDELVERDFDEVAHLMVVGHFGDAAELASFRAALAAGSVLPEHAKRTLESQAREQHPMEVLMALLPILGTLRPGDIETERVECNGGNAGKITRVRYEEAHRADLLRILGALPTVIATFHRQRQGLEIIEPDPSLDYLTNFLTMFHGRRADPHDVRSFAIAAILQMEHGFNASTFTARCVASTLAPMHACFAAAVAALYGKLHGGADEAAFRMARDAIGSVDRVDTYLDELLATGGKVMGLGHRVYRNIDPRARILEGMARTLCGRKGDDSQAILDVLVRVDASMRARANAKGQALYPNVEFYKGPVFHALGIPTDHFTAMFALARAFGWGAHVLEVFRDHRLYRPKAMYVGPQPQA